MYHSFQSVSPNTHTEGQTHTHTPSAGMQFVNSGIRGREAGVIKTAYTVKLQENMAAGRGQGEGRAEWLWFVGDTAKQ